MRAGVRVVAGTVWLLLVVIGIAEERPNILVIVADDLGYGDLGCTGHELIRTPNLDLLAGEGARLTNFYAPASVCSPSRAAMMTGRNGYRHGIYGFIHTGAPYVHLPKGEVTLPQLMRKGGYETALIGKWHVSLNDFRKKFKEIPSMEDYGFDYWYSSDNNTVIKDKPGWWRNGKKLDKQNGYAANLVGKDAVRWLKEEWDMEKPFFQLVHFYEPHWFVDAPRDLVEGYLGEVSENEAYYYAAVENVDREVGRILRTLKEEGLEQDTLVFFTSDHGPATLGKGRNRFRNYGTAKPYRGKKYGLWDGSVHVPGIVRWPGKLKAGTKLEALSGSIDWLPTFCEIAGVDAPKVGLDGESFVKLLEGKEWKRKKAMEWHHYNATLIESQNPNAVRREENWVICGFYDARPKGTGRWVPGHMGFIRGAKLRRFEMYDVSKDLGQVQDVGGIFPKRFEKMKKALKVSHFEMKNAARGWEQSKKK